MSPRGRSSRLVLLLWLVALAGCMQAEQGLKDATATLEADEPTSCTSGNVTLQLAQRTWHLCGAAEPEVVALQVRLDDLEREASNATKAFLVATADLQNATMEELLSWWRAAPNATVEDRRTAALQAVDGLPANVTVLNGTWGQVRQHINRSTELPVDAVGLAVERRLAAQESKIMALRRTHAVHAASAAAGGLLVGAVPSLLLMLQVRRKASYWSAFSATRDIPQRQRWLGLAGLAATVAGAAASILVVILRGWP